MDFIFASHNSNKLEEFRASLGPQYPITSLDALGWSKVLPETEDTLMGNALLKARTVFRELGGDCFADDTGLEIDVLGGQPGVFTARFAGEGATAKANREKTLLLMKNQENRKATFRTVIALILKGREYTFEGQVSGQITLSERGKCGFGYDSIFMPSESECTYAEMPLELRAQISHRALAIAQLRKFLTSLEPKLPDALP